MYQQNSQQQRPMDSFDRLQNILNNASQTSAQNSALLGGMYTDERNFKFQKEQRDREWEFQNRYLDFAEKAYKERSGEKPIDNIFPLENPRLKESTSPFVKSSPFKMDIVTPSPIKKYPAIENFMKYGIEPIPLESNTPVLFDRLEGRI